MIGLTAGDKDAVDLAIEELISGDPAKLRSYLRRAPRDKRFDPLVKRAIREKSKIPASKAAKIAGRYSDGLLRRRGDKIARTELLGSLHHAQDEGLQQMLDDGRLKLSQITDEWDAANDNDTRHSHRAMDGQRRRHGEPFLTGGGYLMHFPGDRSLGAPAEEIINCRCRKRVTVNALAELEPGD